MHRRTVAEVGEFRLIERIRGLLPPEVPPGLILGIGDDAAVIRLTKDRALIATCDIQVEGTHFRFDYTTPYQLGRRALAVNISDVAAMGGSPTCALASLAMRPSLPLEHFDDLFRGMAEQLAEFSAALVGGNLAHTEGGLVVDIFLLGEVHPARMLTRSGARPGDRIMVTGLLGSSAAGLHILGKFGTAYPERFAPLVRAHLEPTPRVAAGQAVADSGCATAMIDISDGLAADLGHICDASGVGAEIHLEAIPTADALDEAAHLTGQDRWRLALHGGEDYELLFTFKPETTPEVIERIARRSDTPISEIGVVLSKEEGRRVIEPDGGRSPLEPGGWNHFRKGNLNRSSRL